MRDDEDRKKAIATFRFGVISDFVCGGLSYGDKERLLKDKSQRLYDIPHSRRRQISRATILSFDSDKLRSFYGIAPSSPKTL